MIPFDLYQSRLNQLEQALSSGESVVVDAFYATENEDEEFLTFHGNVVRTPAQTDTVDQPGLIGSGYHSVGIAWPDEVSTDYVSPWEVSVRSPESTVALPSRPRLNDADKRSIRDTLNHLRLMPGVMEDFVLPVKANYSDYTCRVELPTNLTLIAERVEADYYATKFSFVADIRLILTNCVKYNGEEAQLCSIAQNLFDEAMKRVLTESERDWFQAFDQPLPGPQPTGNLLQWENSDEGQDEAEATHSRPQMRRSNRSTFEELTQSDESTRRSSRAIRPPRRLADIQVVPSRRSSRRMPSRPYHSRNTRAASRSVLEGPMRTLEHLSSGDAARSRGRSAGHRGRLRRDELENSSVRRSTRSRHEIPIRQSARPGLRNATQLSSDAIQLSSIADLSSGQTNGRRRREAPPRVEEAPFADTDSSSEEAHSEDESPRNNVAGEASSDESVTSVAQQRARPQRQTNRNRDVKGEESSASNGSSSPDESPKPKPSRGRKVRASRAASQPSDASSDSETNDDNAEIEEDYREESSDDHESDNDDDESAKISDSDESIENRETAKRRRKSHSRPTSRRTAARVTSESNRPSRKRSRQLTDQNEDFNQPKSRTRGVRATYQDPSSSDFGDETDEDRSSNQRKPPATKKRKGVFEIAT